MMTFDDIVNKPQPQLYDSLEDWDLELRHKSEALWYHKPVFWCVHIILWFASLFGRDFKARYYWQTLPVFFGELDAIIYAAKSVNIAEIANNGTDLIVAGYFVHELGHCVQIKRLGGVKWALSYVFFPLPVYWTYRSSSEFECESVRITWLRIMRNQPVSGWIEGSANMYSGPAYIWPTTDKQGWKEALQHVVKRYQSGDSFESTLEPSVYRHFNGYQMA